MEKNNNKTTFISNNDEILIRDSAGKLKIWQSGKWQDFYEEEKKIKTVPTAVVLDTGLEGPFISPLKPVAMNIPQKKYGINKIVNKTNEVLNLNLPEEQKKRLKNILFGYARHTRDLVDTLAKLQQPIELGGAAFKLIEAEQLMAIVKNITERIEKEGGLVIDEDKLIPTLSSDLSKNQVEVETKTSEPTPSPQIEIIKEPILPKKALKESLSEGEVQGPILIKPKLIKKEEFPRITRPEPERTKQITEVKKRPIIFGPVEELASFSLADFRRLALEPMARANKILKRIEALAEDSLTKKAKGIEAWRESEVHQLYLKLGAESISKGIKIEQLINEKVSNNEETLTLAEFDAVNELSRNLRF